MKLSVARLCLAGFLVLELVLSIVLLLAYRTDAAHQNSPPEYLESVLATTKTRILQLTDNMRSTAMHIAYHPKTLESLSQSAEATRLAHLENIHAFYPDTEIHLVPLPDSGSLVAPSPPTSAHTLPLSPSGKFADSSTLSTARLVITTVYPVTDDQQSVHGYVVIEKDLPESQSLLNALAPDKGYVELQQTAQNGGYTVLAQHGNETLKTANPTQIVELPNTAWRLAVWPAPAGLTGFQGYLIAWLASSILLATVMAGIYYLLRRALQEDARTLVTLLADIRHSRLRKGYSAKLQDLGSTFSMMYELSKLMVGKQKQVAIQVGLDHLSQVHNRRSFEAKQHELFKSLAQGWTHSLLILDIDNFKQVNDTFGHDAGDALIVHFGKALKSCLRSSDFIARLGGDEFCVIFPNTPLKRATELSERLRSKMPKEVELTKGVLHKLSWSGGLSEYSRHDTSENMALSRADSALLDAKRGGRNRTKLKAAA